MEIIKYEYMEINASNGTVELYHKGDLVDELYIYEIVTGYMDRISKNDSYSREYKRV